MRSVLAALCLFSTAAHAVPGQFTHQGRLLDADGVPLEGEADITFRLITEETGGVIVWQEPITLSLVNGFYSAILGADEDDNPLDVEVLSEAPVWLEMQLDGEPAMFPRSPINAVPYATMATVAEEVAGGPVDASEIAVGGTPVVNESGEWVGPAPTISWAEIADMPEDFADGVDNDTDILAGLGSTCRDAWAPSYSETLDGWTCAEVSDADTLAGLSCTDGQLPSFDATVGSWVCGIDAVLSADEVDAIVADNGYAMASDTFSGSFDDLTGVPDGLSDGDDNTQLTEADVDAMVSDNGYAMATDVFSGSFDDLAGVPDGLSDGDDNTQLTEADVDAMVSDNGYAMATDVFSGSFDDLSDLPDGFADGDSDTLQDLSCSTDQVASYSESTGSWACTDVASLQSPGVFENIPAVRAGEKESFRRDTTTGGTRVVVQAFMPPHGGRYTTLQLRPYEVRVGDITVSIFRPGSGSTISRMCGTTFTLDDDDEGKLVDIDLGSCNISAGEVYYLGIYSKSAAKFYGSSNVSGSSELTWMTYSGYTAMPYSLSLWDKDSQHYLLWFRLMP